MELETSDYDIFSPLQSELGSSFNGFQSGVTELFSNQNGAHVQTQYASNETDQSMFELLDSVLEFPYEFPEQKHVVVQPTPEQITYEPRSLVNTSNNKISSNASETGIKIRARRAQAPGGGAEQFAMQGVPETGIKIKARRAQASGGGAEQFAMQGSAARRLRLQINHNSIEQEVRRGFIFICCGTNPFTLFLTFNVIKCVQVKDTDEETITKGCGSFMRWKSSIFEKVAAMGGSYRGLFKAGVVAVVFAISVCSLTGKFG